MENARLLRILMGNARLLRILMENARLLRVNGINRFINVCVVPLFSSEMAPFF